MKTTVVFENNEARVVLSPDNEWEQKLLGAVVAGATKVEGEVTYVYEGHPSYGKAKLVTVALRSAKECPDNPVGP